jgi:hypothetical protein
VCNSQVLEKIFSIAGQGGAQNYSLAIFEYDLSGIYFHALYSLSSRAYC